MASTVDQMQTKKKNELEEGAVEISPVEMQKMPSTKNEQESKQTNKEMGPSKIVEQYRIVSCRLNRNSRKRRERERRG